MGERWLDDPLVQSAAIPLAVALVAALAIGRAIGARYAVLSVPLGWIGASLAIQGGPAWPPVGSSQKLPFAVIGAVAVGGAICALSERASAGSPRPAIAGGLRGPLGAAAAAFTAAVVWVAWPLLRSGRPAALGLVGALCAAGGAALWLLDRSRERGIEPPLMSLVVACGCAPIALSGASASLAQGAGALAAATGGFLLCNWPRGRHPFGELGAFALGIPLLLSISIMVLYTDASPLALALACTALLGSEAARRLPFFADPPRPLVDRLAFVVICAVPVAIGTWVAWLAESTEPAY